MEILVFLYEYNVQFYNVHIGYNLFPRHLGSL